MKRETRYPPNDFIVVPALVQGRVTSTKAGHDDLIDGLIGLDFLSWFNLEIRLREGRVLVELA